MTTEDDVATLSYEQALARLDELIARLEQGSVELDEAIACYERGALLLRRCAELLDRTEARVLQLVVGPGGEQERPFSADAAPPAEADRDADQGSPGPASGRGRAGASAEPPGRLAAPPATATGPLRARPAASRGGAGAELFPDLAGGRREARAPGEPADRGLEVDPDDIPF